MLRHAKRAGCRVGVLSNFSLATLDASLAAVGISDLIDVACAATVIGYSKPDPRAYHVVLKELGVGPEQCLYFDDEITGVDGARNVGMDALWVNRDAATHDLARAEVCDLTAIPILLNTNGT